MLNNQVFYHKAIRNTIVAFGNLFANIKVAREKDGVVSQTIDVPISYSQKEKWVHSIEQNPEGEMGVYTVLPALAFEISGYNYDASRKLIRMNTVSCTDNLGRNQVFTPVPYNIDIQLYFASKTQEDGLQILEQILPFFTPEYTVTINSLNDLNTKTDVPIILNSVSVSDDYEGDLSTRRFVIHTLNFTAKTVFFGPVTPVSVIKQVEADVGTSSTSLLATRNYVASQATPVSPINENWADSI